MFFAGRVVFFAGRVVFLVGRVVFLVGRVVFLVCGVVFMVGRVVYLVRRVLFLGGRVVFLGGRVVCLGGRVVSLGGRVVFLVGYCRLALVDYFIFPLFVKDHVATKTNPGKRWARYSINNEGCVSSQMSFGSYNYIKHHYILLQLCKLALCSRLFWFVGRVARK